MPRKPLAPEPLRPRFAHIPYATKYSGRGRSKLYEWAGQHRGLFKKDGASTLVDLDVLDEILDALPAAEIKAPACAELSA